MTERMRGVLYVLAIVVGFAGMVRNSYVAERYSQCVEARRVYGLTRHFAFVRTLGRAALDYDAHRITRKAYERGASRSVPCVFADPAHLARK